MTDAARHERTIRDVEVAPGRRQDQQPVPVDEFRKDPDGVVEAPLFPDVGGPSNCKARRSCAVVRMPSVMPKLRSFAFSQPGMNPRNAAIA